MSLSDCVKCWETPCRCGHGYIHLSTEDLKTIHAAIDKELKDRTLNYIAVTYKDTKWVRVKDTLELVADGLEPKWFIFKSLEGVPEFFANRSDVTIVKIYKSGRTEYVKRPAEED